jgi:hypothetical protein
MRASSPNGQKLSPAVSTGPNQLVLDEILIIYVPRPLKMIDPADFFELATPQIFNY